MATPSDAHLRAFGSIVYQYATVETGLKICLSGILDTSLHIALILTEPYGSLDLRRVIKSVAKEHDWPDGGLDRLVQIVGDLKPHTALRNNIAHSRWTDGGRPGAIKPRGIDIRQERAVFIGNDPDERDWTAEEMMASAEALAALNRRILQFMDDMGLTARIERHIASASEAKE